MIYLPDVNVWIALAVAEHIHNSSARQWLDATNGGIVFCRVTQMGLLRLLTNRQVLGTDVFSPAQAWSAFDRFMGDSRISRVGEPGELEPSWRASTLREKQGSHWWTDTYLAAFAASAGLTLVTFDAQLASRNIKALLLK